MLVPHYLNPYRTCGDTSVPSCLLWLSEAGRQADIKGELWTWCLLLVTYAGLPGRGFGLDW